jgi:hypothetical protein
MPLIFKAPEQGGKVAKGDTLTSLAAKAGPDVDWKVIARFNWGTTRPREVARAIVETIGVDLKDYLEHFKTPETMPFSPHADVKAELRIPEPYTAEGLEGDKTHTVKVKAMRPAVAVSVRKLDKWFIPKVEECEIKYALSGMHANADKVRMDVFGSNYCDCTDWQDGVGVYDKGELEKEPVYSKTDLKANPMQSHELKWKGDCTTKKGLLGVKEKDDDTRHINVAFSPYTVQLTYHKADLPETDRPQVVLKPFWPSWKMKESTPDVLSGMTGEAFWTNDDDQDGGALEVEDAQGLVVFRTSWNPKLKTAKKDGKPSSEVERPKQLQKGNQDFKWDKKYREGFFNGKMTDQMIDDSAWSADMQKQYLYQSTPYKVTVTTVKPELEADSLKFQWKILNSGGKFKRGFYRVTDRNGSVVLLAPLPEAKMADGEHEVTWDGKYPEGIKNSLGGDEITPWDMPYRVEVQAHTNHGEAEGLAIAVEHSEIRLYTHNDSHATTDPRYDSFDHKPSMMLEPGPLLAKAKLKDDVPLKPGIEPDDKTKDEWFRFKLAESGYHPGPLQKAYDDDFKISIQEFKRSVPANGGAAAGGFARLLLDAGNIELRDDAAKTAIETLRASDKRGPYADLARVMSNADDPNLTAEQYKKFLRDVEKDIVIWADDRQYYTDGGGDRIKDAENKPFMTAAGGENAADPAVAARIGLGLDDYRQGMVNGDGRVDTDAESIPRPWVPLRAAPTLMGREDELHADYKKERVEVDGDTRKAMMAAIGPLRIDWTVEELPYDISTIDPADYPSSMFDGSHVWDKLTETRTRRYLTWALWQKKKKHKRADTKRNSVLTNCPFDLGGVRPDAAATYAEAVFGAGEQSLWPWKAQHDTDDEAMSTIVHDLINKDQKPKDLDKPLVADEVGGACAWFRPSTIGGDGYRVGARVVLKKEGANSAFPNIEALEKRYPVAPQAHSARMRVWRRSSLRGVACWSPNPGKYNGAMVNQFRDYYKPGHVYFVNEGGPLKVHAMSEVFNDTIDAHKTKFTNIIRHNMAAGGYDAWYSNVATIDLDSKYPYPYLQRDTLGLQAYFPYADRGNIEKNSSNIWNTYNGALLYAVAQAAESNGYMRGHLIAEFVSSPDFNWHMYKCGTTATHRFVMPLKDGLVAPANPPCQSGGCAGTMTVRRVKRNQRFNFNGIGLAIGVTWCFDQADANIGVHEVGHHRHFEHCANAPGIKPAMHDHAPNQVVDWTTPDGISRAVWWDDPVHRYAHDPLIADGDAHKDHGKRWDRRCVMSYANDAGQYFCGKCALRNRGWKVTSLPAMNGLFREPT